MYRHNDLIHMVTPATNQIAAYLQADTANSKYSGPVSVEGDLWAQAGRTVKNVLV